MRTIVIYPGRFQPAHLGHKAVYDQLVGEFGEGNVFIATSDVVSPATSPFSFADKVQMWTRLGVPASRVALVKNPYQAQEIVKDVPEPDKTALVFAVGAKDMEGDEARFKFGTKRDGSPSYMQPYPSDGKLKPLTRHAYVMVAPTVNFKLKGQDANSATEVRKLYINGNSNDHTQIIQDLYGEADKNLEKTFDKRLLPANQLQKVVNSTKQQPQKIMPESRAKIARLLKATVLAEQRVRAAYQSITEDLVVNPDYLDEK